MVLLSGAVSRRYSVKQLFWKVWQFSQAFSTGFCEIFSEQLSYWTYTNRCFCIFFRILSKYRCWECMDVYCQKHLTLNIIFIWVLWGRDIFLFKLCFKLYMFFSYFKHAFVCLVKHFLLRPNGYYDWLIQLRVHLKTGIHSKWIVNFLCKSKKIYWHNHRSCSSQKLLSTI